ncbi:probable plastidic glucose transporter 2 isoform X2 [Prunus avium]|nr:probable plastidic glucose transporter 2 isoform X2 [Prunus avium]
MVFIGSTIFALQQLSGINTVFYFSSTVFKSFGAPSDLANICVGIANLSGSVVAMILMDKPGRKVLLLGSFSGMAVAMGLQVTGASSYASGSGALSLSVGWWHAAAVCLDDFSWSWSGVVISMPTRHTSVWRRRTISMLLIEKKVR